MTETDFSYRNVYGTEEYRRYFEQTKYLACDKYLQEETGHILPDGYTLEKKYYTNSGMEGEPYKGKQEEYVRYILKKDGKKVYEYDSIENWNGVFDEFIEHRNGERYYAFHVDLYGICYLNLNTLEVYHYIPEGESHEPKYPCGESFIITDIHYNKDTNCIAYGGCYWACPYDVMVGDFSEPMNFNPKLISIHEKLDPTYEKITHLDFKCWDGNRLYVTDDDGKEYSFAVREMCF